ncbi:MAG: RNA polymerase sigma factor [Bacteroidales bacterium]|nr:RNA polymerase sigma factor [Bacteroidales bacterium]
MNIRTMIAEPSQREKGFRLLMQRYGKALYWHIRRIVVGHEDAEDALQEAAVKIFRSIDSYRGEGKLTSWIYRIATNEALQVLRKRAGLFHSIDSLSPQLLSTLESEAPLDADNAVVALQKALIALPARQRIVFNMRYYDNLSYEEIAEATGNSVGTLKVNYHYAYEKVKKYLQENI